VKVRADHQGRENLTAFVNKADRYAAKNGKDAAIRESNDGNNTFVCG
jgi:hypothetical protein